MDMGADLGISLFVEGTDFLEDSLKLWSKAGASFSCPHVINAYLVVLAINGHVYVHAD